MLSVSNSIDDQWIGIVLGFVPQPSLRATRSHPLPRSPARYLWATLIARLFEIFPLTCRYCGAEMKIIAFVTETPSVRAILAHIGEPTRPPALASARAPPREDAPVELEPDYDPLAQPEPEMEFDQRIQW